MRVRWKHCKQEVLLRSHRARQANWVWTDKMWWRSRRPHTLFKSLTAVKVQDLAEVPAVLQHQCTITSVYSLISSSHRVQYVSFPQIDQVWVKHLSLPCLLSGSLTVHYISAFFPLVCASSLPVSLSALIKFLHQTQKQIFREKDEGKKRERGREQKRSERKNTLSGIQAHWLRSDDDLRISRGKIHIRPLKQRQRSVRAWCFFYIYLTWWSDRKKCVKKH